MTYEFVILARPESIPESELESESTPWVRVGVGVGVTQNPVDSAALVHILIVPMTDQSGCNGLIQPSV